MINRVSKFTKNGGKEAEDSREEDVDYINCRGLEAHFLCF